VYKLQEEKKKTRDEEKQAVVLYLEMIYIRSILSAQLFGQITTTFLVELLQALQFLGSSQSN
jgi:hypothetical protein